MVSYNIDTLAGDNTNVGGIEFLILHEIGHMMANSRGHYAVVASDGVVTPAEMEVQQRMANDIARAILNHGGLSIMSGPQYSPTIPTFETPSGGNGGGSGGGYYAYDLPFYYANHYWNHYQIP